MLLFFFLIVIIIVGLVLVIVLMEIGKIVIKYFVIKEIDLFDDIGK